MQLQLRLVLMRGRPGILLVLHLSHEGGRPLLPPIGLWLKTPPLSENFRRAQAPPLSGRSLGGDPSNAKISENETPLIWALWVYKVKSSRPDEGEVYVLNHMRSSAIL